MICKWQLAHSLIWLYEPSGISCGVLEACCSLTSTSWALVALKRIIFEPFPTLLPWLLSPPFAFIFMIAPCLSLSPLHCLLALPSYYLPVHSALRQSADRIRHIRLLFSKPQAWLRGAVVEIVQVCAFTFFLGACHFTNLPFPTLLSDGRGLIGITSVLLEPDFFFLCLWKY